MILALVFVGSVALTVAGTAVLAAGVAVYLVVAFVIVLLGFFIQHLVEGTILELLFPPTGIAIPIIILGGGALLSYRLYADTVRSEIRIFEARLGLTGTPANEEYPKIASMATQLAKQASIPEPAVRVADESRPESYALANGGGGTIIISRGLIEQLDDREIKAVLAHEVSHLANRDGAIMRWLLVPMLVAEHIGSDPRRFYRSNRTVGESGLVHEEGTPLLAYLTHVFIEKCLQAVTYVQMTLCHIGVAFLSRGREFAADAGAARLTGSPSALASALETLDDGRGRPSEDKRDFRRTASVLDILPVETDRLIEVPFRTHPKTETRIDRLESMTARL
jgi:heat shock protein HtpX